MDLDDFGSLQLRVLEMLWDRGSASAADLCQDWPDTPPPAYTTVLSALQKLYRRRLAGRRKRGRAHVYSPRVDRATFLRRYVEAMRRKVFGGSAAAMVAALFDGEQIPADEMREIQRLIGDRGDRRVKP